MNGQANRATGRRAPGRCAGRRARCSTCLSPRLGAPAAFEQAEVGGTSVELAIAAPVLVSGRLLEFFRRRFDGGAFADCFNGVPTIARKSWDGSQVALLTTPRWLRGLIGLLPLRKGRHAFQVAHWVSFERFRVEYKNRLTFSKYANVSTMSNV